MYLPSKIFWENVRQNSELIGKTTGRSTIQSKETLFRLEAESAKPERLLISPQRIVINRAREWIKVDAVIPVTTSFNSLYFESVSNLSPTITLDERNPKAAVYSEPSNDDLVFGHELYVWDDVAFIRATVINWLQDQDEESCGYLIGKHGKSVLERAQSAVEEIPCCYETHISTNSWCYLQAKMLSSGILRLTDFDLNTFIESSLWSVRQNGEDKGRRRKLQIKNLNELLGDNSKYGDNWGSF